MSRPATLLPLLLLACAGSDKGDDDDEGSADDAGLPVRFEDFSGSSAGGVLDVEIDIEDGETALMITAESDAYLSLEAVYDPDGEEVAYWDEWYGDEALTAAFYPWYRQAVVNWPVRASDAQLTPGTWTIQLATTGATGSYQSGKDVAGTVLIKEDEQLSAGTVTVRLVYVDGLDEDSEVVRGVEEAVERWAEVWAPLGLELDVSYGANAEIAANVDDEFDNDGILDEVRAGTDTNLLMLLCEEIGGDSWTYGVAGNIPWTTQELDHAAVAISWLAHAGGNGEFSDDEIRLMGETMAHEVGHYQGLFHPVEDGWDSFDALDDTENCTTGTTCERELGDNLMFPYPICPSYTYCEPQDVITTGQEGVLQRYAGTL